MRSISFLLFFISAAFASSQELDSLVQPGSLLRNLGNGDSVIFYQCHVEQATQQLSTASGQTLTGASQKYSITEKYVIVRTGSSYLVNYYTAALSVFPNRKFSGLKIREKPYWGFKKQSAFVLDQKKLKILLALEKKGHEAIEYDYVINKYNTNQLIIKRKKDFKQLVIDSDFVISRLMAL